MDHPQVKFGDKIFLYGQYLQFIDEFDDYEYNAVMGFTTVGGYEASVIESYEPDSCVPGFVADFGQHAQFTVATPFSQTELVDVTEYLARRLLLPSGTKIWLPTTHVPEEYSRLL
jgi:hypothetical protein